MGTFQKIGFSIIIIGVAIALYMTSSSDNTYSMKISEGNMVIIDPESIISVSVEEHYGEGHSDARRIEYFVEDGIYYESFFDYGHLIGETKKSTKDDFDIVVDASSICKTVRKYERIPSPIWSYAEVRTKNGTIYYFNDQAEVKTLSDYLWKLRYEERENM